MPEREVTMILRIKDIGLENLDKAMKRFAQFKNVTVGAAKASVKSIGDWQQVVAEFPVVYKGPIKDLTKLAQTADNVNIAFGVETPKAAVAAERGWLGLREQIVELGKKHIWTGKVQESYFFRAGVGIKKLSWMFTWATLSMLGVVWQLNSSLRMLLDPIRELFEFFWDWTRMTETLVTWIVAAAIAGYDLTEIWTEMGVTLADFIKAGMEVKGLISTIAGVLVGFGLIFLRELIPYVREFVKVVVGLAKDERLISWLREVARGIGEVVMAFARALATDLSGFLNAIGGLIKFVDMAVSSFGKFIISLLQLLPIPDEARAALERFKTALGMTGEGARGVGIAIGKLITMGTVLVPIVSLIMSMFAVIVPVLLAVAGGFSLIARVIQGLIWLKNAATWVLALTGGLKEMSASLAMASVAATAKVAAVMALIAALGMLLVRVYQLSPAFRNFINTIGKLAIAMIQSLINFLDWLAVKIAQAFEFISLVVTGKWGEAADFLAGKTERARALMEEEMIVISRATGTAMDEMSTKVESATTEISTNWQEMFSQMKTATVTGTSELSFVMSSELLDKLKAAVGEITPDIESRVLEWFRSMQTATATEGPWITTQFDALLAQLKTSTETKTAEANTALSTGLTTMKTTMDEKVPGIVDVGQKIGISLAEPIMKVRDSAKDWGAGIVDNLIAGIESRIAALEAALMRLSTLMSKYMKFRSVPEKGPLRKVPEWGAGLVEEFVKGVGVAAERLVVPTPRVAVAGVGGGATQNFYLTINVAGSLDRTVLPDIRRMLATEYARLVR